jgi:MFS family permease
MINTFKSYHLLTLILLIALASVTGLLFLPALPELDNYFGISQTQAQQTISIFLIGYCIGQLPYGPLANRFGRKNTLYTGILLSIFGSLLCYLSWNFPLLCLARFIQAIGAAVGLKMSFTIVGDVLSGKEASKLVSLLSIAFGIMPGLAVATGGFIVESFGWRYCFLFLSGYGAMIALLCTTLPETCKMRDPLALTKEKLFHGYKESFFSKHLLLHAFMVSLSTMTIYLFATVAPYICLDRLKMTPTHFGIWNMLPACGLVIGALLSKTLSSRYQARRNIFYGITIVCLGIIIMTICFCIGYLTKETIFISQFIIQSGYNLVWANSNVLAIAKSQDVSNATTAVQFINVGGSVIATFIISLFSPTDPFLLPIAFGMIILTLFYLFYKTSKI